MGVRARGRQQRWTPRALVEPSGPLGWVRTPDTLAWVGIAWLLGPVPGFDAEGVTGQPTGALWWWHLAAGVVLLRAVVDAVRGRAVGLPSWAPGRRWHAVVVVGWLGLAAIAAAQAVGGTASWGHAITFAAAAVLLGLGVDRTIGGESVVRVATGGLVLAALALAAFWGASELLGGEFGFYRVKQQVRVPGAAHNVLASLLLVAGAAVAVQSLRTPRWRWALPLVGLALAATLSRGALLAGAVGVVGARLVGRDATIGNRFAAAVALGGLGMLVVVGAFGAAVPGDGEGSAVARVALWDSAIESFVDEPVAGVGLDALVAQTTADRLLFPHEHAHSLPLHAAATTGLLGLAATAAVWGGLAVGATGVLDRDRRLLLVVALPALTAHAMVDELAFRPSIVGLLALLGLVAAAPRDPAATS